MRDLATHLHIVDPSPAPTWIAPSRSRCNGNCKQGRACDCVPAVEPPEEEHDSSSAAAWAGSIVVACAVSMLVGVGLLARSFALSLGWL